MTVASPERRGAAMRGRCSGRGRGRYLTSSSEEPEKERDNGVSGELSGVTKFDGEGGRGIRDGEGGTEGGSGGDSSLLARVLDLVVRGGADGTRRGRQVRPRGVIGPGMSECVDSLG